MILISFIFDFLVKLIDAITIKTMIIYDGSLDPIFKNGITITRTMNNNGYLVNNKHTQGPIIDYGSVIMYHYDSDEYVILQKLSETLKPIHIHYRYPEKIIGYSDDCYIFTQSKWVNSMIADRYRYNNANVEMGGFYPYDLIKKDTLTILVHVIGFDKYDPSLVNYGTLLSDPIIIDHRPMNIVDRLYDLIVITDDL